ncbi:hypothetical protein CCUS01_02047 [Colletotrichum cuscutae]|uniref:Uncharacterized protein n=1 Tax=Colletotrichum cuscutae TaxID=1209917 RepID=A0AAI9UBL7_9PEZI|nr:hypothetical protein CCUS01_02047 [Colletotrichum cuscutae]
MSLFSFLHEQASKTISSIRPIYKHRLYIVFFFTTLPPFLLSSILDCAFRLPKSMPLQDAQIQHRRAARYINAYMHRHSPACCRKRAYHRQTLNSQDCDSDGNGGLRKPAGADEETAQYHLIHRKHSGSMVPKGPQRSSSVSLPAQATYTPEVVEVDKVTIAAAPEPQVLKKPIRIKFVKKAANPLMTPDASPRSDADSPDALVVQAPVNWKSTAKAV